MVQIVTIITWPIYKVMLFCPCLIFLFLFGVLSFVWFCTGGFVLHFVHKGIAIGDSIIMKECWIPVPGISPPHLCFCPKPRSGFTPAYVVVVNLLYSLIWGEDISCYWWNSWPSLCKLSFHNVCKWTRQMSGLILLFAETAYWENQDWTNAIYFGCSYYQYEYVK